MENTLDIEKLIEKIDLLENKVANLEDKLNHDHEDLVMLRQVTINDHEDLEKLKQTKKVSNYIPPAPTAVSTHAPPVGL